MRNHSDDKYLTIQRKEDEDIESLIKRYRHAANKAGIFKIWKKKHRYGPMTKGQKKREKIRNAIKKRRIEQRKYEKYLALRERNRRRAIQNSTKKRRNKKNG